MKFSVIQAAALLLFNTADRLSYSEIMMQLNLTHEDVVRLLHSLSCAKYKILSKEPNTKTISPNDSFEFNSKFTDKMRRIKVCLFLAITLIFCFINPFDIEALLARLFSISKVIANKSRTC